jgi:hypothetical protein
VRQHQTASNRAPPMSAGRYAEAQSEDSPRSERAFWIVIFPRHKREIPFTRVRDEHELVIRVRPVAATHRRERWWGHPHKLLEEVTIKTDS